MNAKISVFFICVEAIIYLPLYNLHDCNFKGCLPQNLLSPLLNILSVRTFKNLTVRDMISYDAWKLKLITSPQVFYCLVADEI